MARRNGRKGGHDVDLDATTGTGESAVSGRVPNWLGTSKVHNGKRTGECFMSVKTILPFGDPVLRKVAKPIEMIDAKLLKLLTDLADTLYAGDGRAGLAAPQIGILRRVVVMDCGNGLLELINPEIVEMRGQQVGPEACLSFPGYTGTVKRAKYVRVKSLNRKGETIFLEGKDYLARCMQHEIDHLNGILFIDHIANNTLYQNNTKQRVNLMEAIRLSKRNF